MQNLENVLCTNRNIPNLIPEKYILSHSNANISGGNKTHIVSSDENEIKTSNINEHPSKNRENMDFEMKHRKRKRSSPLSYNNIINDASYKAHNSNNDNSIAPHIQRRKQLCQIDENITTNNSSKMVAYAQSIHLDHMKLKKDECFPVLKCMPRSSLIKYCDYYNLRFSKRSTDDIKLVQIVTEHFILHNREKNKYKSTNEMHRELFWHAICYQDDDKEEEKSDSIRKYESIQTKLLPEEECFEFYDPDRIKLSEDKHMLTHVKHRATVYGRIKIESMSKTVHQWTFEKLKGNFGIGIDETKYVNTKDTVGYKSYNETKTYGLFYDSDKYSWDSEEWEQTGLMFGEKDMLYMILDLKKGTLSYRVNSDKEKVVFNNIKMNKDIVYCMAIRVCYDNNIKQTQVSLLEYKQLC